MKIKSYTLFWILLFQVLQSQAQESINTAGNNITNASGNMSYSIGQVLYSNFESAAGRIEQGVLNSNVYTLQNTLCNSDTLNKAQGMTLTGVNASLVYFSNLYLLAENNGTPGFYLFKPSTKTVSNLSANFTYRKQCGLAEYKGKIYCMGGTTNAGSTNSNEVYDIASNTWQVLSNMPVALQSCKSFTIGNYIYVLGNASNGNQYFYQYNPQTNAYVSLSLPGLSRRSAAYTAYQNKLYMVGGQTANGMYNNVDVYDPATATWIGMAYLPMSLSKAGISIYDNKLYVFGGMVNDSTYSTNIYAYDFTTSQWNQSGIAAPGVLNPESAQIDQVVYLLGGNLFNGAKSNTQLKYFCRENLCQCMW